MDLRTYYFSLTRGKQRNEFVGQLGILRTSFWQIICRTERSRRKPSAELAKKIHDASGGSVSLHSMRPDLWAA